MLPVTMLYTLFNEKLHERHNMKKNEEYITN